MLMNEWDLETILLSKSDSGQENVRCSAAGTPGVQEHMKMQRQAEKQSGRHQKETLMLKINIDGAFTEATDKTGQIRGAAQAEVRACDEAAHAAADWGLMTNIQFESDAQNLVEAMQGTVFDRTPRGMAAPSVPIIILHLTSQNHEKTESSYA